MPARTPARSRTYPWHRFWTASRDRPTDGFFEDAPDESAVELDEHWTADNCLILLGEPGLGKTYAIDEAARRAAEAGFLMHRVHLGAYDDGASLVGAIVDAPAWQGWRNSGATMHLYLDGLDEALLHVKAITKRLLLTLEDLDARDRLRLRLRLSCRSAEWLDGFGADLGNLLGTAPVVRRLAPLREADVRLAALVDGLDADAFLTEITRLGIERLAANPLTLRMLLDDAAADAGRLPDTQEELFERASLRLLEEHDVGRRRETAGTALHAGKRLAVAERISAAMLLSGRAAVTIDATSVSGGDVRTREIAGFMEQDPDAAGDAHFEVGVAELAEVIATAFFVDLGGGRFGFWHRVLGEFLAARYLLHHDMDLEQIMSLLASADHPDGRLIPELREVTAWVAAGDQRVLADVIAREPDVLLRTDALALSDAVRAEVVSGLLSEAAARRVDRWDQRMRAAYRTLRHPGLGDQLRAALAQDRSFEVQQAALTLAQACELPDLQPDLLSLALDAREPSYLRDDAVWALKDYADRPTREGLVPLATQPVDADTDDEIKGQALQATFPEVLDAVGVLRALTPPRNSHLIGMYRHFATTFPAALKSADLAGALAWAAQLTVGDDADPLLTTVADGIVAAAWPHLADVEVLDGLVDVVLKRMDADAALTDGSDERAFREPDGRRRIVVRLVERHGTDLQRVRALMFTSPPLLLPTDTLWLLERAERARASAQEHAWAALAAGMFRPGYDEVAAMFGLVEKSDVCRDAFEWWLTDARLDSESAVRAARRAERRRSTTHANDAEEIDQETLRQVERFEAGEVDGWWRVNVALAAGPPYDELQADLTRLPAWSRATQQVRERIIAGALPYLEAQETDPEAWFGADRMDRPAFAAYRALYLLAACRPQALDELTDAAWERWMPIVIHYPKSSGIGDPGAHTIVLATAASRRPNAMIHWVLRAIDVQGSKNEGHLFVLSRLRGLSVPEIDATLAAKIQDPQLRPTARAELVAHVFEGDQGAGLAAAKPYLTPSAAAADPETAVEVGSAAMGIAPGPVWQFAEPLFTADPATGVSIIEGFAYGDHADVGAQLDDEALARLVEWMFTHLPPEDDPAQQPGAHWVSPRESAVHLRDRLIQVLAQRGSDLAVATVERLAYRHPTPAMDWRVHDAREAQLARWTGPEPAHVVELAKSSDARIVLSTAHLQLAVMAALRRISGQLRRGSPDAATELWEPAGPKKPKSEEALSTWLAQRLQSDLHVGGRLVGRELQVRENRTGKGRGESVDIIVATPLGPRVAGAPTAVVMIEAKGTWHQEVKTALSDQLAARYLSVSTRYGIYLVFWFARDCWDTKDWRRGKWTKDLVKTKALFERQARDVTSAGDVIVQAFVLDGSVHEAKVGGV